VVLQLETRIAFGLNQLDHLRRCVSFLGHFLQKNPTDLFCLVRISFDELNGEVCIRRSISNLWDEGNPVGKSRIGLFFL